MKTVTEKNEIRDYYKRVHHYLEMFRLLRDRAPVGLEEILGWTPDSQVFIVSKTIEYNLHDSIETIRANVNQQCETLIAEALRNKTFHVRKGQFPDDYIKDTNGNHVKKEKLFIFWDKIIAIYTRYKKSKHNLKSDLNWFRSNYKLRNISEIMAYVHFADRLIDAANLSPDAFYATASIPFTESKKRKPYARKTVK